MVEEFSIIGKRLPRADAVEKVKGEAKYTSDLILPGMLYARFLRSPHAHARIVSIDTSKAEALTGVKCILTHKNVPHIHPVPQVPGGKFEYLLDEIIHGAGEEVAAIAAISPEIASKALKLIDIEYEVLPAVTDKDEAIKPGAPLAYPELMKSNLYQNARTVDGVLPLDFGDIEKGFKEADFILEDTYEAPFQHHVSPEPRSVLCQWIGEKLTCWASTQVPQKLRLDLSLCLNIPLSSIRVIATYAVGGYGAKDPEKTATLAAIMARRTGRPLRAVFSRAEDFVGTHRRMDCRIKACMGLKKDGTIIALHTKMYTNFGRGSQVDYFVPSCAAVNTCSMLYHYNNSKWEGYHIITNTQDHGAFNGFGDPESGFCIERLIDEAAEKIGMDPVEFRLKNCMRYGDIGMELDACAFGPKPKEAGDTDAITSTGVHFTETKWGVVGPDIDSFPECIRQVRDNSDWRNKWKGWTTPVAINGSKKRGIGIACGMHHCIAAPPDSSIAKLNQDGTLDVLLSDPDIGQGLRTACAMVTAETLGIPYESVNVILSDTSVTPNGPGVFGSRGTSMGANAAYLAALDVRRQLFDMAAPMLKVKPEELEAKEGLIRVKTDKSKAVPILTLAVLGYQITGHKVVPYPWYDSKTGKEIAPVSVAATVIEVEVDTETGQLDVMNVVSAHDCGKAINPQIVENQIDLSMNMGNGWVRTEEGIYDKKLGIMLNPNMLDYKILTILDMPEGNKIKEIFVEFPAPWGAFGAKGFSETATATQAPALANAVYNAIGVRIKGDHLTPPRIMEVLGKKQDQDKEYGNGVRNNEP